MRTMHASLTKKPSVHAASKPTKKCPVLVLTRNEWDSKMKTPLITGKFMDTSDKEQFKHALELTETYMKLTPTQIAERLKKRKLHPLVESDTLEKYRKEKKAMNKVNVKQRQQRRLWREFLMPLKAEIKNTKVMMHNHMGAERHEALSWYLVQLESLHEYFDKLATNVENTPASVAKAKTTLLNDGTHWSDWASHAKRQPIKALFAAIPKGVRTKIPFERRMPKTLNAKLRERLMNRTRKEMESAARTVNMLRKTGVELDKIDRLSNDIQRMRQAIEWIKDLSDTGAVPTTWHGFYKGLVSKQSKEVVDYEID